MPCSKQVNGTLRRMLFQSGAQLPIRGRIEDDATGEPLLKLDIAAIRVTVKLGLADEQGSIIWSAITTGEEESPVVIALELEVDDVFFDSLQPWQEDNEGYNLSWLLPEELAALIEFVAGESTHAAVELFVELVTGRDFVQRYEGPIIPRL